MSPQGSGRKPPQAMLRGYACSVTRDPPLGLPAGWEDLHVDGRGAAGIKVLEGGQGGEHSGCSAVQLSKVWMHAHEFRGWGAAKRCQGFGGTRKRGPLWVVPASRTERKVFFSRLHSLESRV